MKYTFTFWCDPNETKKKTERRPNETKKKYTRKRNENNNEEEEPRRAMMEKHLSTIETEYTERKREK